MPIQTNEAPENGKRSTVNASAPDQPKDGNGTVSLDINDFMEAMDFLDKKNREETTFRDEEEVKEEETKEEAREETPGSENSKNDSIPSNEMADVDADITNYQMNETEQLVMENLDYGHYVDGVEIDRIQRQYESQMNEFNRKVATASNAGRPIPDEEIKKEHQRIHKELEAAVKRVTKDAPKYTPGVEKSILKRQLRIEDQGHMRGGEMRLYIKEKNKNGKDNLRQRIYGQNRIGEINKMLRAHEKRVSDAKRQKAHMQKDKFLGGAKQFSNGDAENMFKGSVSMSMHAALYLLTRLAQFGHAGAQYALYKYALNKTATSDLNAALQDAINGLNKKDAEESKESQTETTEEQKETYAVTTQKNEVAINFENPPTIEAVNAYMNENGGNVVLGKQHDLADGTDGLPPFDKIHWESGKKYEVYPGVAATYGCFFDKNETLNFIEPFYTGKDEDIRAMFEADGKSQSQIEVEMAKNNLRKATYEDMKEKAMEASKTNETKEEDLDSMFESSKGDSLGEQNLISGPTKDDDNFEIDLGDDGYEV